MKLSTFQKRTSEVSRNSNGYKNALNLLETGKRQYTCHISGRGRFTTNIDNTNDTINILQKAGLKQGIDFIPGNDSARGGKIGNFVELTSKGKRKVIN